MTGIVSSTVLYICIVDRSRSSTQAEADLYPHGRSRAGGGLAVRTTEQAAENRGRRREALDGDFTKISAQPPPRGQTEIQVAGDSQADIQDQNRLPAKVRAGNGDAKEAVKYQDREKNQHG